MTTQLDDEFLAALFADLDEHAFSSSPLPLTSASLPARRPLKLQQDARDEKRKRIHDQENTFGARPGSRIPATCDGQGRALDGIAGQGNARKREIKHVEITLEKDAEPSPLKRSIGRENQISPLPGECEANKRDVEVVLVQEDYDQLLEGMEWDDNLFASQEPIPIPRVSDGNVERVQSH